MLKHRSMVIWNDVRCSFHKFLPHASIQILSLLCCRSPLPACSQVSGDITYNGHALTEFLAERTAAYVAQSDSHIAELTVRDTLDFSAAMHGPAFPPGGIIGG